MWRHEKVTGQHFEVPVSLQEGAIRWRVLQSNYHIPLWRGNAKHICNIMQRTLITQQIDATKLTWAGETECFFAVLLTTGSFRGFGSSDVSRLWISQRRIGSGHNTCNGPDSRTHTCAITSMSQCLALSDGRMESRADQWTTHQSLIPVVLRFPSQC